MKRELSAVSHQLSAIWFKVPDSRFLIPNPQFLRTLSVSAPLRFKPTINNMVLFVFLVSWWFRTHVSRFTFLRAGLLKRIFQTISIASSTILPFILLVPTLRSWKMIGVSLTLNPICLALWVTSIWNE